MPTWSGIAEEIRQTTQGGTLPPDFDVVRRRYLLALQKHTGRNVILYATNLLQGEQIPGNLVSIVREDLQGLMEVVHGIKGPNLDLILHSPGGSLDAAESLVHYLRSKFRHIRAIIPMFAYSAATMIACAADEIVMGKHSYLGPTDPQILVNNHGFVPAQSILDQFYKAVSECQDPKKLPAWVPMLGQYGPHLLVLCENAQKMSQELVAEWLVHYMFRADKDRSKKAEKIATWLSDHRTFKSHGRPIHRNALKKRGVKVAFLEKDQTTQDLVLSAFHATTHAFEGTHAVKIIENHSGRAFIKFHARAVVQKPAPKPRADS